MRLTMFKMKNFGLGLSLGVLLLVSLITPLAPGLTQTANAANADEIIGQTIGVGLGPYRYVTFIADEYTQSDRCKKG